MAPEQEAKLRVLHPTDGSVIARRSAGLLKQLVLPAADRLEVLSVAPHSVLSGARPDPFFLTKVTPVARKRALIESEELAQQVATEFDPPPIVFRRMPAGVTPFKRFCAPPAGRARTSSF